MDDLDLTFLGVTITPSCCNEDSIDQGDSTHPRESQRRTRSIKDASTGKRKNRIIKKDRHVIQHDYHDHASDPIDFDDYVRDCTSDQPYDKKKGGVGTPFPLKLHELLERAEIEHLTDIISWQPHGRAFVVHQPKKFVSGLMPRFFRQTKLTSFQRQLNLYGFNRLTKGPDAGGYYHELFLRGKHYLTKRMVRTKIKGTGFKAASNPECEPDFYSMPPVGFDFCQGGSGGGGNESDASDKDYFAVPIVTPNEPKSQHRVMNSSIGLIPHLPLEHDDYEYDMPQSKHFPFLEPKTEADTSNDISTSTTVAFGAGTTRHCRFVASSSNQQHERIVQISNKNNSSNRATKTGKGKEFANLIVPCPVATTTAPAATTTTTDDQDSLSISPSIFDDTYTTEESQGLQNDCFVKATDPLAVFLDEMGDGFEDDINFGNTAFGSYFAAI